MSFEVPSGTQKERTLPQAGPSVCPALESFCPPRACCHSCSHSDYTAHHAALLTNFFSQFPHRKDSRVGSHAARLYIRLSLPNRVKGVSWEAIRHREAQSHRGKYWCLTGAGLGDVGFVIFILALILLTPSSLKH